jgi:hypothetical protein
MLIGEKVKRVSGESSVIVVWETLGIALNTRRHVGQESCWVNLEYRILPRSPQEKTTHAVSDPFRDTVRYPFCQNCQYFRDQRGRLNSLRQNIWLHCANRETPRFSEGVAAESMAIAVSSSARSERKGVRQIGQEDSVARTPQHSIDMRYVRAVLLPLCPREMSSSSVSRCRLWIISSIWLCGLRLDLPCRQRGYVYDSPFKKLTVRLHEKMNHFFTGNPRRHDIQDGKARTSFIQKRRGKDVDTSTGYIDEVYRNDEGVATYIR